MALHNKVAEKKSTAAPISYKNLTIEAKDLNITGRIVTGYLCAYGNIDGVGDRLLKGCCAKSIAERGVGAGGGNTIAHLWQHKMDMPLGNYKVLTENDYGLYFECEYDDIQKANDALVQFKSGTLKNFSIGYSYVWDKMQWNEADQCFDIYEINLYEGSVVTLACNPDALYTGMKAQEIQEEKQVLMEEANELLATLKPRKRFELSQIFTKLIALSDIKPPLEMKEALKQQGAAKKKKALSKLSELAD